PSFVFGLSPQRAEIPATRQSGKSKTGRIYHSFREAKPVPRTGIAGIVYRRAGEMRTPFRHSFPARACKLPRHPSLASSMVRFICAIRSEEHTSELQSRFDLVC